MKEYNLIDNYIVTAINKMQPTTPNTQLATLAKQSTPCEQTSLTLSDMTLLATIAQEQAKIVGIDIVFSLVDNYGLQRFYFSMPNALLVSHTLATKKAYSAVAMKMPTHQLTPLLQPNASLYGLDQGTGLCGIGGGFPCWRDELLIAGIGVSGGTVEQDIAIVLGTMQKFGQLRFSLTAK